MDKSRKHNAELKKSQNKKHRTFPHTKRFKTRPKVKSKSYFFILTKVKIVVTFGEWRKG